MHNATCLPDEVLARLLELNEQRHKKELLAGSARAEAKPKTKKKKRTRKKATRKNPTPGQQEMF